MPTIVSIFNNKGGVGKTTFLFHIAHRLANRRRRKVLMVDCDSQCNLTAYCLTDQLIERAWSEEGNSIYRAIERVDRTIGDIRDRAPTRLKEYLFLQPGDLLLSGFEDRLGDTWSSAKGGSEAAVRAQSAILRSILASAEKASADLVLVDLGPNLGALNRSVLSGCNYIIVPIAPDLFSLRGTENLGSKLMLWRQEWDQCNVAWRDPNVTIPAGQPKFVGYVLQQHNVRNNAAGMTRGWQLFGDRITAAVNENIVNALSNSNQVLLRQGGNYNLGQIPNLHSLVPYSLEARKPIFECTSADGLVGAHTTSARDTGDLFDPIADVIESLV